MCCIFSIIAGLGPRLGILVWYVLRPERWQGAFQTWIWPLLGSLFLPWTTLVYVWRYQDGIRGWEVALIVLAVLVDIGHVGGGARSRSRS
jgi:hypothetical protein